jgi:hydroxymethylpyrimidine/phosphomethylpyrimidine kinase
MVSNVPLIESIAAALSAVEAPAIVLDPVMISKSGYSLLRPEARDALIEKLFPLAEVVTPNIHEAETLLGNPITTTAAMESAARRIRELGPRNVVVKGGHLGGPEAVDLLYDGREARAFTSPRFETRNTHGTGCTFSAAIAANLALGRDLVTTVDNAKTYITGAIANALSIGKGHGPTHHFYELYAKAGMG